MLGNQHLEELHHEYLMTKRMSSPLTQAKMVNLYTNAWREKPISRRQFMRIMASTLYFRRLLHTLKHTHALVSIMDGNQLRHDVVCIPHESFLKGRRLTEVVIDHTHETIGHFGLFKTSKYIQCFY
jgi:hypothetical protein